MEKREVRGIIKTIVNSAAFIGAGAVVGCLLKNADLRSLKGLGKICAGIGIIGLSHAAGQAAGNTLTKEVDDVFDLVDEIDKAASPDEESEEVSETVAAEA